MKKKSEQKSKDKFEESTPDEGIVVLKDYKTIMDKPYDLKKGDILPKSIPSVFLSSLKSEGVIK